MVDKLVGLIGCHSLPTGPPCRELAITTNALVLRIGHPHATTASVVINVELLLAAFSH